jgi:hypothetical protein
MRILYSTITLLLLSSTILKRVECFTALTTRHSIFCVNWYGSISTTAAVSCSSSNRNTLLLATGGSSKKKRRRKTPPEEITTTPPTTTSPSTSDPIKVKEDSNYASNKVSTTASATVSTRTSNDINDDIRLLKEISKFEFKDITMGIQDTTTSTIETDNDTSIPLPDISDVRRRKKAEEDLQRMEIEKDEKKVRIKRSDKEAFRKVNTFFFVFVI